MKLMWRDWPHIRWCMEHPLLIVSHPPTVEQIARYHEIWVS